jgi:hypothetical protein
MDHHGVVAEEEAVITLSSSGSCARFTKGMNILL